MDNLGIVKASNYLKDGIDGTDVGQEGVSKTSTSRRTAGETSDIINGQVGRDDRLGLVLFNKPVEAVIGNDDTGFLGVDGGIREVLAAVSTPNLGRRAARGLHTAGLPRLLLVMAWKRVDLPTFARPTCRR